MKKKKEKVEKEYRLATVDATVAQLKEIGVEEDLGGKEVKVYDIDKYGGMYAPCSGIIVDNQFEWLREKGVNADYIFPTRWLKFKEQRA
jgi:hypothetical protein